MIHIQDNTSKTSDLETGSRVETAKKGWIINTVKVGDTITTHGYKAKTKPIVVAARSGRVPPRNAHALKPDLFSLVR